MLGIRRPAKNYVETRSGEYKLDESEYVLAYNSQAFTITAVAGRWRAHFFFPKTM